MTKEIKTEYYKFVQNRKCEYFPCHETTDPDRFNCLFCYCPLYLLKEDCGGHFSYDNEWGIKDCSGCMIPHGRGAYDYIVGQKSKELVERARKQRAEK